MMHSLLLADPHIQHGSVAWDATFSVFLKQKSLFIGNLTGLVTLIQSL